MNKLLLPLFTLILIITSVPANAQAPCATEQLRKKLKAHKKFTSVEEAKTDQIIRETILSNRRVGLTSRMAETEYVVPVVVHIMHLPGTPVGTAENLSDESVELGIAMINDALNNQNDYFSEDGVDLNIRLCLAKRDPNDWPTNGITRTATELSELDFQTNDSLMKSLDLWDGTQYLNIWLVKEICYTGATECNTGGYATYPYLPGGPEDGVVIVAELFSGHVQHAKIGIHELGHYFNLHHTFNDPGNGACVNDDCLSDGDKVCDTPPDNTPDATSCHLTANTCTSDEDDTSENNPFRPVALGGLGDQNDMIENYMDYGYQSCQDRFTRGQKERMITTLTTLRKSLLESSACIPVTEPPVAGFQSIDIVCKDVAVAFNDTSTNGPDTWNWTFEGGTPAASNDPNPVVSFSTPGEYDVTFSCSNSIGKSDTITKTISVFESPIASCIPNSVDISNGYNMGIFNVRFHTIDNSSEGTVGDKGYMDHSCSVTTSLKPGTEYPISVTVGPLNDENVAVYIDYNNDGSFSEPDELVWESSADKPGTHSGTVTPPLDAVQNELLRMRVISNFHSIVDACEELVYGQAEDYGVVLINNVVTATGMLENAEVKISPNPLLDQAVVSISNYTATSGGHLVFMDIMGKVVKRIPVNSNEILISKESLKAGLYYLHLENQNGRAAKGKIVVR